MKKITATFLLLATVFTMMSARVPKPIKGWKTYETKYYTIQYPPDWKIDSQSYENELMLIPPKITGDKFDEGVTVYTIHDSLATEYYDSSGVEIVKEITLPEKEYSLDSTVRRYEAMLKDTMKLPSDIIIHHIDESVRKSANGVEYYSITVSHENKYLKWKSKLNIYVKKNRIYEVGFMASQKRYKELIKTANKYWIRSG